MQEVTVSPSERLHGTLDIAIAKLAAASHRLATHPRIRDLYPDYLVALHGIIRASVPLMEIAQQRAAELAEADDVAAGLERYLATHIDEERHHDEWLLDDLETLGRARGAVLAHAPSPRVAAAVGAQYYWILHYHPVALLGYIAVLEGYPPSPESIDDLERRTGHRPEAFGTLRIHAELDPGHRDELDEAIDGLPLSENQQVALGLSALSTVQALCGVVDEIIETRE